MLASYWLPLLAGPPAYPHQATLTYVLAGFLTTVLFFASLLAHELAHSLVARHYGLKVKSITLWLFGGVSELSGKAPRPSAEAWIAGVVPLTSLLLGGIFIGLAALARASHPARASLAGVIYFALVYLGATNVMLAVFNMIPAAPLDGGRLLRAIVWSRTGDRVKATVWADRAGQAFGWICVAGGLYIFFLTRDLSWVWFSLIGWFISGAATAEAQQAVLASRLRGIRASQVMTPDPVTVPGSMTVGEFVDDYLLRARHQSFPVTGDGGETVTGLVTLDRIKHVPAGKRDHTRLADVACPLAEVATASPEDSVADILPRLTGCADMVTASTASNVVAKGLVSRPRPAVEVRPARRPGRTPVTTSFPSGHAAAAAAFATGVGLEMPALAAPVGALAAAVGIARVVNGVHYPSDIVGGWAVGVGVAMLTLRWRPLRRSEPAAAAGPGHEAAAERDLSS